MGVCVCAWCLQHEAVLRRAARISVFFCYCASAFYEMIHCSVVVLHLVFRLAVLVCWFDAMFYPSLTLDVSYCADNVLAGMLELDVHTARPGCCGRAYVYLWLYAFDHDDLPCWPTCTRRTPADSCATTDRGSQSTTSSANVSIDSQRIYYLMTLTICTSTVITRLVAVHL